MALLGGAGDAWALNPDKAMLQFPYHAWRVEDGLPQNSILSVAQTPDGYLWAGTWEGLVRFDGVRFTTFDEANTPALPDNAIRRLVAGPDGTLWIASSRGVTGLRQGTFFLVPPPLGLELRNLIDLMAAQDGSLWIATFRHGLLQRTGETYRRWTTQEGLANDSVLALAEAPQGAVWIGTTGGLQRWDGAHMSAPLPFEGKEKVAVRSLALSPEGALWAGTDDGDVYQLREGGMRRVPEASLPGAPITSLLVDRAGTLWVGSQGKGPLRWANGQRSAPDSLHGLAGSSVFGLFEDAEGNLWMGTDGRGLHRFKDAPFTPYGAQEGLAHEIVLAIHEAHDGSVWLATMGGGVFRMKDGQVRAWTTQDGLVQDRITSIAETRDGSLWFGSWNGVSRWTDGKLRSFKAEQGVPPGLVRTLHEDPHGTLWIGTEQGLARWTGERFEMFTPKGGLPGKGVTLLKGSAAGGVWVGTSSGGLAHLQDGETVEHVPANGKVTGEILALHEDPSGAVWIGTERGLYRWKKEEKEHPTRFTRSEGLFDNRIFQILPDDQGFLWMSCNKGVFRVALAELEAVAQGKLSRVTSRVYGTEDGMRSEECNGMGSPAGIRARDGRLWFPTIQGAAVFVPENEKEPAPPPPVLIEEVRVDGRLVPAAEWEEIPVGEGGVEIHYTSAGLRSTRRLRFRYLLEGIDTSWVNAGSRRVAYYTRLPPGQYRFRVVADSPDGGPSSAEKEIRFYLRPRFHQTLFFQVACVLAGVLAVVGGVWLRMRRLRQSERELQVRVAQHTAELATVNVDLKARLQELQTTRQRLAHAEKMAAVGTLAAGVGHEINNPLAFIISNLHYAAEEVHDAASRVNKDGRWAEEVEQALREALEGADRVRKIVQDLKAFSRVQPEQPQQVDPHVVLDLALSIADTELRHRAQVVKNYTPGLKVLGDETRLGQVFLNLLVNAAQAIPEGRTQSNEIRITTRKNERGQALVEVTDTGTGIPAEVLPRIFEPFFTTKPVGMGTGLGLSICHSYVQAMGGDIRVHSEVGRGTTFEVVLPLAPEPARSERSRDSSDDDDDGPSARLMVIDDEPLLTTALSRMLEPEHEVEAFTSAHRALERLRSGEEFALILCDLMMPEMTGMELYATLCREAPELAERMVFITGGAFTEAGRSFLEKTHLPWLEKPFEPDSLQSRIRGLLSSQSPASGIRAG
ncbi:two-component regulator propeller domain-containing protein [Hyalangium rubrum]|uniref:histidine kinase n=1 Tax=Hyalangium rubrum TaxID=3103134 RepID=A0ABU5H531_9BACT|nr:two-component regulator propeller domain-containing protein [Hyalangium sp. s54d21]MDY7228573.1 two-component regulator propeller domain-containing protein [Hyalangium sp. s54d21]